MGALVVLGGFGVLYWTLVPFYKESGRAIRKLREIQNDQEKL